MDRLSKIDDKLIENIKGILFRKYIFLTCDEYKLLPRIEKKTYHITRLELYNDFLNLNEISIGKHNFYRILASISYLHKTSTDDKKTVKFILAKLKNSISSFYYCQKCPVKLQFIDISDKALQYVNCKCGGDFLLQPNK
jgi:pyruvate formate-lyase activating enzyme-like uncharacterized protein